MEYDKDKVDEIVLALLYLTSSRDKYGTRAWKGLDWHVMDRLHEKGYISNPKSKSSSVALSEEAAQLSEKLAPMHTSDSCSMSFAATQRSSPVATRSSPPGQSCNPYSMSGPRQMRHGRTRMPLAPGGLNRPKR